MKYFLSIIAFIIFFLSWVSPILAVKNSGDFCDPKTANPNDFCSSGYSCQIDTSTSQKDLYHCQRDALGKVDAPQAIKDLGIGSSGISSFLNMSIILIYIIAGIVFVFMILFGAFQFLTSGGNKEQLDSARKRITFALIGIILFAVAFAVISLVGRFTGFTFFSSSNSLGCTGTEVYYPDTNTGKCIHKVFRNNVPDSSGKCEPVFIEVEDRFCK